MNVRSKAVNREQRRGFPVWVFGAAALLVLTAATLGYDAYSGKIGIFEQRLEIVQNGAIRTIKVPAGGNLQAAIDRAASGDIVELQAGATYYGEIKLPNKPLTDFVTIQSSSVANMPTDKRVGPQQASQMAKIATKGGGKPAVSAENGANHYRFIGIEFTASNADYIYNLVLFGSEESRADRLPHDLEIDRSYLHPYKTGVIRRGIALNSAKSTVTNSYIEGFAFAGEETQGICGWTGTRNVKVINNYIEGGAENIMFGGSDIASVDLIPSDIEVRGNHLNKPESWKGKAALKTLFELKNAKRVQFTGNLLTNNWVGAAFRITVRNETGGSPYNTIEDVVIKDNIIDGSGDGINILGSDNNFPSQILKRLDIINNLLMNIGGKSWDGSGYFFQVGDGEDITIANNTILNTGHIATIYGTIPKNLVVRDNIVGHGNYGVHGPIDLKSAQARTMFRNNVFMNLNRIPSGEFTFPPGNTMVGGTDDIGFINASGGDYRLSPNSKFKGKGSNITRF